MSLSQNIRHFRVKRNMTQEQLADIIGVSPQAVSKWERSETYPDGALLLPLARALEVSLDVLFDYSDVSMEDISRRITTLFRGRNSGDCFALARELGWQMEKALFFRRDDTAEDYIPGEIESLHVPSLITTDGGFSLIANGKSPFFTLFPEPEDGYAAALGDGSEMATLFARLADPHVMSAVLFLHRQTEGYVFAPDILTRECGIGEDALDGVLASLTALRTVRAKPLQIDGIPRVLYEFSPRHELIALLLMTQLTCYIGTYTLTSRSRRKPLLK